MRRAARTARGSRSRGSYSRDCGERVAHFSVLEPPAVRAARCSRSCGGSWAACSRAACATAPRPRMRGCIAILQSPALSEIVRDINKYSNNVMARQLCPDAGRRGGRRAGHARQGEPRDPPWLVQQGTAAIPELVMENGSGLSRIERISARSLGQLLLAAFRSAVMPELMASLPGRRGGRNDAKAPCRRGARRAGAHQDRDAHRRARDRRLRARRARAGAWWS